MSQRVKLSTHARQRIEEMALEEWRIRKLVREPEVVYPCDPKRYPPPLAIYLGDKVAVVFNPEENVVVTVLWRGVVFERPKVPA